MLEEAKNAFGISMALIPFLSIAIILVKKFFPNIDPYFEQGNLILAELDDIIDSILLEFPENKYLNTIDDLLEKILSELDQAGYTVNAEDIKKIENRLKSRLKQEEGFKLNLDLVNNEYRISYKEKDKK